MDVKCLELGTFHSKSAGFTFVSRLCRDLKEVNYRKTCLLITILIGDYV